MPDLPKNIDEFNLTVAHIFAVLYQNFPVPTHLERKELAEKFKLSPIETGEGFEHIVEFGGLPSGQDFWLFVEMTADWLVAEGLIRRSGPQSSNQYVLTKEALSAMNKVPEGLSSETTLGNQLANAAKHAGRSAGNAALGDLVGQVIGGVTKSFIGG